MAVIENKRIDIYGHNVKLANERGIDNLTSFVNKLLEKFYDEILVEIEKENKESLDAVSKVCNKSVGVILNSVIKSIEIVPPKPEKIKIELEEENVQVKKKRIRSGKGLDGWRYE